MPDIKELAQQLGADQQAAYRAEKALRELVTRSNAPGKEEERRQAAAALAAELSARTDEKKEQYAYPADTRSKLARLLGYVLTGEALMALMSCLRDFEVRESARMALDFSRSPAATKALILALDEVGPEFRVGVVGALGRRGSPEALAVLQRVAQDDADEQVRFAAIGELANFPDPANDAIISAAARGWRYRARVLAARIELADTLRRAGKSAEAAAIYRSIQESEVPPHCQRAAEIGLKDTV